MLGLIYLSLSKEKLLLKVLNKLAINKMWHAITLFVLSEAITCPNYKCSSQKTTSLECIVHKVDSGVASYTVTPCEEGYECIYTPGASSTCSGYLAHTRYPGEYCSVNADCRSNDCLVDMCIGFDTESQIKCATTADCHPGLYCNSNFACVAQLADGIACSSDDQCANDHVCDGLVCTLMFSKVIGTTTTHIEGTFASACASGYAVNKNSVYQCSLAPTSVNAFITSCPESGFCTSSDGLVNKACECGYSGKSYCPLFEGDKEVVEMITLWKKLFSYSTMFCNGLSRWSYACFFEGSSYSDYLAWSLKKILYFDGLWYKDVNLLDCVSNTILLDYKDLQTDYQLISNGLYKCPAYEELKKKPTSWQEGQCINYSKEIYSNSPKEKYQYYPCSKGTCNGASTSSVNCTEPGTNSSLPGEYCSKDSNCQSGYCKSHRCFGQAVNLLCNGTLHCNPGLYCSKNSTCTEVSLTTCSADSQCNSTSLCLNSLCTLRFSVVDGMPGVITLGNSYGYSEACKSGFAAYDKETETVLCKPAPMSMNNKPLVKCIPGAQTTDSTGAYNLSCMCSYDGTGYYPAFIGDYKGTYIKSAKEYFFRFAKKATCYDNQFHPLCLKHDSDLVEYYYHYFYSVNKITKGYMTENAKDFAVKVFENDLYVAIDYVEDSSSSSSSFATGLVMSALAYLALV